MSIYFAKFRFSLRLLTDGRLPAYLGPTLRGGFGHVFRRNVCISQSEGCEDCLLRGTCAYSYCFETPTGQEMNLDYDSSHYPHPFVIEPPLESVDGRPVNGCLRFNLVLVGKAIDYLPYFVFVFDELGRAGIGRDRARYILETVEALASLDGSQYQPVYDCNRRFVSSCPPSITFADAVNGVKDRCPRKVAIGFLTPTRIMYQGRLAETVDFQVLIKNILRRLSLLSEMHCGSERSLDYRQIIDQAATVNTVDSRLYWRDMERYSSRQKRSMKLGGFVGSTTFEGDLGEFMPLLKLGEYLHVGKGTSFGLGQYHIKA